MRFGVGEACERNGATNIEGRLGFVEDEVGGDGYAEKGDGEALVVGAIDAGVVEGADEGEEVIEAEALAENAINFVDEDDNGAGEIL